MSLTFADLERYGKESQKIGSGTYGIITSTDQGFVRKSMENKARNIPSRPAVYDIVSLLKVKSPYVIPLIDVNIGLDTTTMVIPLANGSLEKYANISTPDIKRIITQLCLGVADIHNANLLHLDIKPENILLHDILTPANLTTANVWITDLGLSRIHTCVFPPIQGEFFSVLYRSPEVALQLDVTAKSDVWAVGVVLAELLISRGESKLQRLFKFSNEEEKLLFDIFKLLGSPQPGSYLTTSPYWLEEYNSFSSTARDFFYYNRLSEEEIDIVLSFLVIDPYQRPSIFQALQHPWFGNVEVPIEITCFQALITYSHYPNNNWIGELQHRSIIIIWLEKIRHLFNIGYPSLALGIYLIDRVVSLNPSSLKAIRLYACACLYIGTLIHDKYIPRIEELIYAIGNIITHEQFGIAVKKILTITSFDVAVATSYFFLTDILLSQDEAKKELVTDIWRASLLTPSHFHSPQQVAADIIQLSNLDQSLTPSARVLLDEILSVEDKKDVLVSSSLRTILTEYSNKLNLS